MGVVVWTDFADPLGAIARSTINLSYSLSILPMLRFIPSFCGILTILTLNSCSVLTTVDQASPPGSAIVFEAKTIAGFKTLRTVIKKTETAVKAGDFTTARKEFDRLRKTWNTVENDTSNKSIGTYITVERCLNDAERELKRKETTKSLTILQRLDDLLATEIEH